jgi:hypothetical protein
MVNCIKHVFTSQPNSYLHHAANRPHSNVLQYGSPGRADSGRPPERRDRFQRRVDVTGRAFRRDRQTLAGDVPRGLIPRVVPYLDAARGETTIQGVYKHLLGPVPVVDMTIPYVWQGGYYEGGYTRAFPTAKATGLGVSVLPLTPL